MSDNGTNGRNGRGGQGAVLDPHHVRASLRMIQRAVNNGWNIKDEWLELIPAEAVEILTTSPDERNRLRAMELIQAMIRDATSAAVALDKIERLDDDRPTEIVYDVRIPGTDD